MKAILSNRIYLEVSPEYGTYLKEVLTYQIPSYNDPNKPIIIRNFGIIKPGLMTIPIGRLDLIPADYEVTDKRIYKPVTFPKFRYDLRESQQEIHDGVNDNAIINATPSWGKTFASLAIAGKLEQKTLVVVHTVPLRNQWSREVKKVYGIEPGIIGSSKFNIEPPIVIGNVQSLYNCMDRICKEFGTIILDEMHHVSSPTFSKVVDKSYSRYKIGLSGTLERKDKKHVVFRDYFGTNVFKPSPENRLEPEVDVVEPGIHIPEIPGKGSWAHRVTALNNIPEYRQLLNALADKYVSEGHKVLIVSDRIELLKDMAKDRPNALAIVGSKNTKEMEQRELEIARISDDINEIWGTLSIFVEGISVDPLSCVILATPTNNEPMLKQLIGRIQRMMPGKPTPKVVDIKLSGWTARNQFQTRLGYYMRQGYPINYL